MNPQVSRSEARLLALVRAIFEGRGEEGFLVASFPLADQISPAAMGLLEHTLAVGCVQALARGGGWKRERRPRGAELVDGRLWERHEPVPLHFTGWSYRILASLLRTPLSQQVLELAPPDEAAPGDRILAFLIARSLHRSRLPEALSLVQHEPLVQLGFHRELDVDGLLAAPWLLEAFQQDLEDLWVGHLEELAEITAPLPLIERNVAFHRTLDCLLGALEAHDRRDLADFLIEAARRWIPEDADWMPQVELEARHALRDRTEARRALCVFPGVLLRLSDGIHRDASVNFFEDGYDAAQARLKQWERLGPIRLVAARTAIERLQT